MEAAARIVAATCVRGVPLGVRLCRRLRYQNEALVILHSQNDAIVILNYQNEAIVILDNQNEALVILHNQNEAQFAVARPEWGSTDVINFIRPE